MSVEYLLTCFFVVITPGTGMIYTLACALGIGLRGGVLGAFGSTLSIVPHIMAATLGLAALLHASALAFQIVKFAGVLYLLFMAWKMLRDRSQFAMADEAEIKPRKSARIVVDGILASLLNPKLSVFFLAFLPQFIDVSASQPVIDMIWLGAVFMGMTFLVFVCVAFAAAKVRDQVLGSPKMLVWLKRTFAATFVALSVRLALAER